MLLEHLATNSIRNLSPSWNSYSKDECAHKEITRCRNTRLHYSTCSDKTGTLTKSEITVSQVCCGGRNCRAIGKGVPDLTTVIPPYGVLMRLLILSFADMEKWRRW